MLSLSLVESLHEGLFDLGKVALKLFSWGQKHGSGQDVPL